jgi:protein-S-isoprenylcysteine O-methyltransferase Ste14
VIAIVVFRIRDEEALMRREFGAEWEVCCEKTRKLIPRIW